MIHVDLHMQTISCACCEEVREIPRRILRDPEQVLNLRETFEEEHRECHQYESARMATAARQLRRRIGREFSALGQAA